MPLHSSLSDKTLHLKKTKTKQNSTVGGMVEISATLLWFKCVPQEVYVENLIPNAIMLGDED